MCKTNRKNRKCRRVYNILWWISDLKKCMFLAIVEGRAKLNFIADYVCQSSVLLLPQTGESYYPHSRAIQAYTIHRHLRRKSYNNGAVRQNAAIEFEVPLLSYEVFRQMDKVVSLTRWDFPLAGQGFYQ
jgi:hypothetical protein